MSEQKQETIEYEEVAIKVPKRIMNFLRANEKTLEQTAKEYIEYVIVDCVRSDIDALTFNTPKIVVDNWKLNPIFKAIVNDEIV